MKLVHVVNQIDLYIKHISATVFVIYFRDCSSVWQGNLVTLLVLFPHLLVNKSESFAVIVTFKNELFRSGF